MLLNLVFSSEKNIKSTLNLYLPTPGPSIPYSLSGRAIAGIILACLAAATVAVLLIIYGPEKWRKRHTYPWYRKLTTPREWPSVICPSSMRRHSRRRCAPSTSQQANTSTTANSQSAQIQVSSVLYNIYLHVGTCNCDRVHVLYMHEMVELVDVYGCTYYS